MINSKTAPKSVATALIIFTALIFLLFIGLHIVNYKNPGFIEKMISKEEKKDVTFSAKQKLESVTIDGIRYLKLITINKDTLYNAFNLEDNINSLAIINTIDSTMMGKTVTWRRVTLKRLPNGITTISK